MTNAPIKYRKFNCPHCDKAVLTSALASAPYTCPHCTRRIHDLPPAEQIEAILDEKGLGIPIAYSATSALTPTPPSGLNLYSEGWAYHLIFLLAIAGSYFVPLNTPWGWFHKILATIVGGICLWLSFLPLLYLGRIARALEEANYHREKDQLNRHTPKQN